MKDLVEEAAELQVLLETQDWNFCFIGGLAIQRWSEPRLTKDMDLTLLAGFGDEEPFVDFLLAHYTPRRADARDFALTYRVLLLQTASGIGIDIALAGLPFEETAVRRSIPVEYAPGIRLRTCTAEDLIVMKAFADRPQDRIDLRGILVRQGTGNLKPGLEAHLRTAHPVGRGEGIPRNPQSSRRVAHCGAGERRRLVGRVCANRC